MPSGATAAKAEATERPATERRNEPLWGSDALALALRDLDIPYVALVPGSSFRGLHDSLVNVLGNRSPQMLVCLHEEHAVAIAHGYAKVTERPMAAAVHANVGLMHAAMAVYDAWCDRAPLLLINATGPVDEGRRRAWIDWIHTSRDQGALVRPYVKWDDQPASIAAAVESLYRAYKIADTWPKGPAYVCLDAAYQEDPVAGGLRPPKPARRTRAGESHPDPEAVRRAAEMLSRAQRPLILAGRCSRSETAWSARIALAERLGAKVLTDLKVAAAFPTDHPLHAAAPRMFPDDDAKGLVAEADVILSLDWLDLGGTLADAATDAGVAGSVISATLDERLINGWSHDQGRAADVDLELACHPDIAVAALLAKMGERPGAARQPPRPSTARGEHEAAEAGTAITLAGLARTMARAGQGRPVSYLRLPIGWPGDALTFRHPLDHLGFDGGGGVGSGPGMAVGSALALRGSDRLPVAVLGDGDFLMGGTAFWTAAHYRIPLLVVVANNRSYFNDEIHQERVAVARGRPVENRWIGQRLDDPPIDVPGFARSLGLSAPDSVTDAAALPDALADALAAVAAGETVVLDVAVLPGYAQGARGREG